MCDLLVTYFCYTYQLHGRCKYIITAVCKSAHQCHVRKAVRCTPNSISIEKPTRCTNVSNLFYFGMTLYMFRTVFPSIINSSRLYIQQQSNRYCCTVLLASNQQYLFDCCCMYSLELLMMDGKTIRNV